MVALLLYQLGGGVDDGGGGSGRGGLESDGKEDNSTIGIVSSDLNSVERRIYDPNVGALRLSKRKTRTRAGNFEHIAEGDDDCIGLECVSDRLVDVLIVGDADGATGTADELDVGRQNLSNAGAENGDGMSAAHFHQSNLASDIRRPYLINVILNSAHVEGSARSC